MIDARKLLTVCVAILATVGVPLRSYAGPIIYSSIVDLNSAPASLLSSPVCSACANISNATKWEVVDFFTLSDSYSIDGVAFDTGSPSNDQTYAGLGGLTVKIWNASLSSVIFSQTITPTLINIHNWGFFDTDVLLASLNGPSLSPDTYGISFFASNLQIPIFSTGSAIRLNDTECGISCGSFALFGGIGFKLEGEPSAVPAPATLPLFAAGLGVLAWLRRKRGANG